MYQWYLLFSGPKHQCSMKPIKHNEHGNLSHDRLHKNDHFLPPINFKASLKQTKPKKGSFVLLTYAHKCNVQ